MPGGCLHGGDLTCCKSELPDMYSELSWYIYIYAHPPRPPPPPSTDPGSDKKAEGATDSIAAHSGVHRIHFVLIGILLNEEETL